MLKPQVKCLAGLGSKWSGPVFGVSVYVAMQGGYLVSLWEVKVLEHWIMGYP